jgi:hypothetical protein
MELIREIDVAEQRVGINRLGTERHGNNPQWEGFASDKVINGFPFHENSRQDTQQEGKANDKRHTETVP